MTPYFEQGGITIYHGDARDILPTLDPVDLVLADPPYGIGYGYDQYEDSAKNLQLLITNTFHLLRAKRIVLFPGINNVWKYPPADWILSYSWDSTTKYGALGYNQWQPILFYGKDVQGFGSVNTILKSDSLHFNGGRDIGFLSLFKDKEHPCPKPRIVIGKLVARFSKEKEVVLDYLMGSGTALVEAKRLNRLAIGIELSERYCEIAARRIMATPEPLPFPEPEPQPVQGSLFGTD